MLLVIGVVAGLLLGGVFGRSPQPGELTAAPADEPVAAPPSFTTTTARSQVSRLATLVPGLVDAVVITTPADLGGRQVWVWEATDGVPVTRPLPGGELANDLSGGWLTAITPNRFSIANALWVGDDNRMDPVATNVISATWSRAEPARVVWSEITPTAETVLVEAHFQDQAQPERRAIARIPPGSYPVWWTGLGVVVTTTRELTFIDPDGVESLQLEARFLGGGRLYGVIASPGETARVVSAARLETVGKVPWSPECTSVVFSPVDPATAAVLCGDGGAGGDESSRVEVWRIGGEGPDPLDTFDLMAAVEGVDGGVVPAWSPDGRFLVVALPDRLRPRSDLLFVDMLTGEQLRVPFRARILGLAFART